MNPYESVYCNWGYNPLADWGEAQGRSFSFTSPWTALAPIVLALLLRPGKVRNTSALLISTAVSSGEKPIVAQNWGSMT